MPNFVALLRGINVNGKNIIRMDDLRECMGQLGFTNVRTYVQSGNVVFHSASASTTGVSKAIERAWLSDFGFAVPVLLRTPKRLAGVVAGNPFLKLPSIESSSLYTTFLLNNPPSNAAARLQQLADTSEQLHLMGREIYLHCPAGYGNTKLSNVAIEKQLSVVATTRNWRTVCALMDMAQ